VLHDAQSLGSNGVRLLTPNSCCDRSALSIVGDADEAGDERCCRMVVDVAGVPTCSMRPLLKTAMRLLIDSASP
jgi:hypothetical protein